MTTESPTTQAVNPQPVLSALSEMVRILTPLTPDERERAISGALVVLGQTWSAGRPASSKPPAIEEEAPAESGISPKGSAWMRKNGIARGVLDHVFSIEGEAVEVIAHRMPGSSKRQQTIEAYVVCGLKSLLQGGEPSFTDKDARAVCEKVGCYDIGNHYNYTKALGNLVAGSKDAGWRLTNPGLNRAAEIVQLLTPKANA